jgi:Amt family ammonium transporter
MFQHTDTHRHDDAPDLDRNIRVPPVPEAGLDPATGLANRWLFVRIAEERWRRAQQETSPLAMVLVSIDRFHELRGDRLAGTQGLRLVAEILACHYRKGSASVAGRVRDHDFALLLTEMTREEVEQLATRICSQVAALHFEPVAGRPMTVSAGVAALVPPPDRFLFSLLIAADKGLRQAVAHGGNCAKLSMAA